MALDPHPKSDEDVGARVKAARTYARLEPADLAAKVTAAGFSFSRRTLDRLEAGERHLDVREARVIADECGVPLTFLTRGWWSPADLTDRVGRLEEVIEDLRAEVTQARAERNELTELADELAEIVEQKLGVYVRAASQQDRPQQPAGDRPKRARRPTQ